jgi:hypothetical protein
MILFAGFLPVAAAAVENPTLDSAALRALFHSPAFNAVCPLTVYSDDFTNAGATSRAALAPSPAQAKSTGETATSVIREMLRNADFVFPDGLDAYGEEFVSVDL